METPLSVTQLERNLAVVFSTDVVKEEISAIVKIVSTIIWFSKLENQEDLVQ